MERVALCHACHCSMLQTRCAGGRHRAPRMRRAPSRVRKHAHTRPAQPPTSTSTRTRSPNLFSSCAAARGRAGGRCRVPGPALLLLHAHTHTHAPCPPCRTPQGRCPRRRSGAGWRCEQWRAASHRCAAVYAAAASGPAAACPPSCERGGAAWLRGGIGCACCVLARPRRSDANGLQRGPAQRGAEPRLEGCLRAGGRWLQATVQRRCERPCYAHRRGSTCEHARASAGGKVPTASGTSAPASCSQLPVI